MAPVNWILGQSIDSEFDDGYDPEHFLGYLLHLDEPACVILVAKTTLKDTGPITVLEDQGHFYRDDNKNIELIITEWLDDVAPPDEVAHKILMEAAVHLDLYMLKLAEKAVRLDQLTQVDLPMKAALSEFLSDDSGRNRDADNER